MPRLFRAEVLRLTGRSSIDPPGSVCDATPMDSGRSPLPDVVNGARAAGALIAGDLIDAVVELEQVSMRYLIGFFCRLALLTPGVSLRLAWRVARRRFARPKAHVP